MDAIFVLVDLNAPAADAETEPDGGAGAQTEHGPEDGVDSKRRRYAHENHRTHVVRVHVARKLLARVAPARPEAAGQLEVPFLGGALVERAVLIEGVAP